jgi:hypothetical protein
MSTFVWGREYNSYVGLLEAFSTALASEIASSGFLPTSD